MGYRLVLVNHRTYNITQRGCMVGECRFVGNHWVATVGDTVVEAQRATTAFRQIVDRLT